MNKEHLKNNQEKSFIFGKAARLFSILFSTPIFLIILIYLYINHLSSAFVFLLSSFLVSSILIMLLRLVFMGERENLESFEGKFSHLGRGYLRRIKEFYLNLDRRKFASAHVARVVLIFSAYYLFFGELGFFKYDVLFLGIIFSLIVGFSRVYLKRHTFIDIIFGFIVGGASAYLVNYFFLSISSFFNLFV